LVENINGTYKRRTCFIAGTPKQVLFSTKSADGGRNPPAVDEIALR
jgi:hypothetical protein